MEYLDEFPGVWIDRARLVGFMQATPAGIARDYLLADAAGDRRQAHSFTVG